MGGADAREKQKEHPLKPSEKGLVGEAERNFKPQGEKYP